MQCSSRKKIKVLHNGHIICSMAFGIIKYIERSFENEAVLKIVSWCCRPYLYKTPVYYTVYVLRHSILYPVRVIFESLSLSESTESILTIHRDQNTCNNEKQRFTA